MHAYAYMHARRCPALLASPHFIDDMHLRMTDGHGDLNGLHFDGGDFFSVQVMSPNPNPNPSPNPNPNPGPKPNPKPQTQL